MQRILFLIFAFFASAVFAADASFTSSLPQFQGQDAKFQRASTVQEPIDIEGSIDSTYIVGPGDYFEILTPKGIDVVQVSPEGNVSVAGCGIAKVDSLQLSQAKAAILNLLLAKFDEKFVQVQIVKMRKVHVSALGALMTPGFRSVDAQTRLSTMISYVNGFQPLADKRNMKLIRGKDTLKIDYTLYERDGVDSINVILQKLSPLQVIALDTAQSLEESVPEIEKALGNMGYTDIKHEMGKATLGNGTYDVLYVSSVINGVNAYQASVLIKCSGYVANITFSTFFENGIEDLMKTFYSL